jgi:hypothetical protein
VIDTPWQKAIDVELVFVVITSLLAVVVAIGHSSPGRSSKGFVSLASIFIFFVLHTCQLDLAGRSIDLLCDSACTGDMAGRYHIAFCGRGMLRRLSFRVDDLVYFALLSQMGIGCVWLLLDPWGMRYFEI